MRKNRYLTSTVIAGLFVTSVTFSPAMGQEQSLQPQGAWAITKVDRSTQGGNSYCTLSRKYDNDIVLSLGRNETEEYSLAIDFQKPTFEKDKSIKVNLQPGPGQIRAYDMMPTSEKAVVIRLGWDTGFFDALNQSQQMKVSISNKGYSFLMPEVAKGQDDLRECMEGLQSASKKAKGGDVAQSKDVLDADAVKPSGEFQAGRVAVKPATADKTTVAAQEKAVLKDFADAMSAQENAAVNRRNFAKTKEDAKSQIKPVVASAAPVKEEIIRRPKPSGLTAADMAATMNNVVPAAGATNDAQMAALQKQIDQLAAENKALKQSSTMASNAVSGKDGEIQSLQQKLSSANAEIETFRQQASGAATKSQEQVAALQQQMASLTTENANLKKASDAATQKAGEIAALQASMANLERENQELTQKSADIKTLQDKLSAMTAENETLKKTNDAAAQKGGEVAALQSSLAVLQTENQSLKQQTAEIKTLQDKVAAIMAENDTLKKSLTAGAAKEGEVAALKSSLAKLQTENDSLIKQNSSAVAAPAADIKAMQDKIAALTAENEALNKTPLPPVADTKALEDKIAALTAENEALKKAPALTPLPGSDGISAEAQKQIDDLKAKLAQVEQEKAAQVRSSEVVNLTEEIKQLKAKNEQLQDTVRQTQVRIGEAAINTESKSIQRIAELEGKLAAAQKDNETLARDMESLKKKQEDGTLAAVAGNWDLEQATKRYNESQREIRRISLQLEQEKTSCNREKAEIEQMLFDPAIADQKQIEKVSALQDELDATKAKLAQLGGAAANAASIAPAAGDVTISKMPDDDSRLVALRAQVKDLQGKLETAEMKQPAVPVPAVETEGKANAAFAKQMAQMKEDVNLLRDQNDALRLERDNLHAQLDDAQNNGSTRADRVAAMELEMQNMKRQMAMVENQNVTYQNQLAQTQKGNKSVQVNDAAEDEIRKLRARLDESERQNRVMAESNTKREERSSVYPDEDIAMNVAAITPSAGAAKVKPTTSAGGNTSIQNVLQKAGVSGGVQKASAGMPGADNYAWNDNGVSGLASVKSASNFDKQVQDYIAYQKGKCGGDFASMPSPSNSGATKRIALYEVACVNGGVGTSSSVVFYEDGGKFVAIANQTGAENMDVAMDSRDKIADVIKGM